MPKSRNAALARLDIIVCGIQSGETAAGTLIPACKEYIDNHIHKLYAFNDIRRIVGPNKDHLSTLLDYINQHHASAGKVILFTMQCRAEHVR